jgi:hypothetical protein
MKGGSPKPKNEPNNEPNNELNNMESIPTNKSNNKSNNKFNNKFDNNKFNNKFNNNNDNNGNASGKEKVSVMNTSSSNVPFEERELENATPENIERAEEKEKLLEEASQEKEAEKITNISKKMARMQKSERELNNSAKPIRTESESTEKKALSNKKTGVLLNSAGRNLLKLKKTMRKKDLTSGNLKNMNRLNLTLQEILRRQPTTKEEKKKMGEIQKTISEIKPIFNRVDQMRAKKSQNIINKEKQELARARMQVEREKAKVANAEIKVVEEEVNVNRAKSKVKQSKAELNVAKAEVNREKLELAKAKAAKQLANYRKAQSEKYVEKISKEELRAFFERKRKPKLVLKNFTKDNKSGELNITSEKDLINVIDDLISEMVTKVYDKQGFVSIGDLERIKRDAKRAIEIRLTPEEKNKFKGVLGEGNLQTSSSSSGEPGSRIRL